MRHRTAASHWNAGAFSSFVRTKMIKTFSLSAMFFLTLAILAASYSTLPI